MLRIAFLALTIYAYGAAPFDGVRPEALDAPVRGFHDDVNRAAGDGAFALNALNWVREGRYLEVVADTLSSTTL